MAAKDLITLARAYQALQGVTGQDSLLSTLITGASDAIEKYCRRDFTSKSYDELYSGTGDRRLMLRQYPVQAVTSVRYRPVTVLKVINNATAQNQQARAQVTSTGLQLWRMASGTAVTETLLTWAAYPTLTQLANAVTALGNGWSAQVVGDGNDYGSWPSADLYVSPAYGQGTTSQGNLTARGAYAELKMHTLELQGYQWDVRGWLLRAIPYTDPELLHPEDLIWPVGVNNFRVQHTAGYTTVPEAVQEACAEWVAVLFYNAQRDSSLHAQDVQGIVKQVWQMARGTDLKPPANVARLLAPFRRYVVGTDQG
jgi:hypothetical protein